MGQKVHPFAFRLGYIYTWPSRWFARKEFREYLRDDIRLRQYLKEKLRGAGVDLIGIERQRSSAIVTIHTAKPGMVIGRGGTGIEALKKELKQRFFKKGLQCTVNIQEIAQPSLSAVVVAEGIRTDLEKRIPFRTALRGALGRMERSGARGAKITVSGRLNGAEIARDETLSFGTIPLQNLRADIAFTIDEAQTIYGKIGIKVWIYRGEIFEKNKSEHSVG